MRRAASVAGPTMTGGLLASIVVGVVLVLHSTIPAAAEPSKQATSPQVSVNVAAPQLASAPTGSSAGQDPPVESTSGQDTHASNTGGQHTHTGNSGNQYSSDTPASGGDPTKNTQRETGPSQSQPDDGTGSGQHSVGLPETVNPALVPSTGAQNPPGNPAPPGPGNESGTSGTTSNPAPPGPGSESGTSGTTSTNDPAKDQTSTTKPGGK